jgi:hypothetical protein
MLVWAVGAHGAGPVGKNTVVPITILQQERSFRRPKTTMTRFVVGKR